MLLFRVDGVFDLRDIKDDDDHIYASAREEDGSVTSYSTIKTHKSQPSLGSVIIKDEILDKTSVKSFASKKSSSSSSVSLASATSSSSSSSSSDNFEAEARHSEDDIIHIVEEPIYANVHKEPELVHDSVHFMSEEPEKVEVMDVATSASLSSSDPSSSSSSSSSDEDNEEEMIVAEHTASQTTTIEQHLDNIINQPMPVIEYDLGADWDLPERVDQMEREILEAERKYSQVGDYEDRPGPHLSSQYSHYSHTSSNLDVFEVETKHSVMEDSLGYLGTPNMTSTQLDNTRERRSASSSSSSSSSSSDAPTKTLAESDLTIPLSQQIYENSFMSGDLRGNQKQIAVMSSSSSSLNSEVVAVKQARKIDYQSSEDHASVSSSPMIIKKATKVTYQSSDDNETPRMIRKATPVVTHPSSSSDSEESVANIKQMSRIEEVNEDSTGFELDLTELIKLDNGKEKPKTKQMRGSNHLAVPRLVDSRMERISETSENGLRSSSEDDPNRNPVRRNSSGITSSSFIAKLSPDYTSVYSREEEQKRRSRDQTVYSHSQA